jgi:hypothetical protein
MTGATTALPKVVVEDLETTTALLFPFRRGCVLAVNAATFVKKAVAK